MGVFAPDFSTFRQFESIEEVLCDGSGLEDVFVIEDVSFSTDKELQQIPNSPKLSSKNIYAKIQQGTLLVKDSIEEKSVDTEEVDFWLYPKCLSLYVYLYSKSLLEDSSLKKLEYRLLHPIQADLPEGWILADTDRSDRLLAQLKYEMPPGHILYEKQIKVVAYREGSDDILCQDFQDIRRFFIVHLTYTRNPKQHIENPVWPSVSLDGIFESFLEFDKNHF